MRAVVDDRSLLQLNGGRPGRTSRWRGRSGRCSPRSSGVLIAAEQPLSAPALTLLVINAYAVAVVGRLRSLPRTFLGAVILGLLESYAVGYISGSTSIGPISLQTLPHGDPGDHVVRRDRACSPRPGCGPMASPGHRLPLPVPSQRLAIGGGIALVAATAAIRLDAPGR